MAVRHNCPDGTVTDLAALMAFDTFPAVIRRAIADAPFDYSSLEIREQYLKYWGTPEQFAARLRQSFDAQVARGAGSSRTL